MVLIASANLASPSAAIFSGVSIFLNNGVVALFTDLSVAWADSATATSKVKGLVYSSSVLGDGLFFLSRAKKSSISARVINLTITGPAHPSWNKGPASSHGPSV